jgi:hypothetical protein
VNFFVVIDRCALGGRDEEVCFARLSRLGRFLSIEWFLAIAFCIDKS